MTQLAICQAEFEKDNVGRHTVKGQVGIVYMVSQKCQYAVRAVFELAKQYGHGPIKISEIAEAQDIPLRFLEVILNQLRRAGFVQSRRGAEGGYLLARQPEKVMVGEIVQFIDGPMVPVACMTEKTARECALQGNCVFIGMWKRAAKAVSDVYDMTSFRDLINEHAKMQPSASFTYSI
jgi:Rrf2 family transcriptional regulator, cysteine metabolism repressor